MSARGRPSYYFAFDGFSIPFTGGCAVHMWASNSSAAALISRPIIGAHQEQTVQVTAFPLGVVFVPIERLTSGVGFIGTVSSFWFAREVRESSQFISSSRACSTRLLSLPRCKTRILNSSYPFIIGSEVPL
jgi:hypothetical protein